MTTREKQPRPSPSQSAALYKVGARKSGNDAQIWIVVADKNGTHRWRPAADVLPGLRKYREERKKEQRMRSKATRDAQHRAKRFDALVWLKANPRFLTLVAAPKPAARTRASLVRDLLLLAEGWGLLTGRNQDLPEERLRIASMRELRDHDDWFRSSDGRATLLPALARILSALTK